MNTKHTDSVEALKERAEYLGSPYAESMSDFDRLNALIHLAQSIPDALTTLQATHSQQVEEAVRKMFNLDELEKEWQEHFYESEWHSDTLEKTQLEKDIEKELGTFLPRHMDVYDWNLPYIDFITLVVRKHIRQALTPNHQN